uniref:Uncharacterized protein n=1 Tax=Arundo donax TaxID=35708 RepID=A0A0A9BR73_ARUDO
MGSTSQPFCIYH